MKITTYLTLSEVDPARIHKSTAVVIDVIRATSTIVEALANGARAIYPTLSTDEAIRLANSLGREETLLCGERKGVKVEGFDLGNSPGEFTRDRVRGKGLVMSTTNGTRALLAAQGAERILAGALLNLSAVARALEGARDVTLVCAGKEDRFSMDDALCAGLILQVLLEGGKRDGKAGADPGSAEPQMDDASRAAMALARAQPPDEELLRKTAAGAALAAVGLEDDLAVCAEQDRHALVPEMHDRMIRLPRAG
jgi:2-phosphosulfolactate phosphatase